MSDDLPDHSNFSVLKGVDASGNLVAVVLDSSGAILAVLKGEYSGTLHTVKLDAQHRMVARVLGSIDDTVNYAASATAAAGTNYLDHGAVPAGKLFKVTVIAAQDANTNCSSLRFNKRLPTYSYVIGGDRTPTSAFYSFWQGEVWLKAGERIRVTFYGCTAGDFLSSHMVGVEIDAE